MQLIDALGFLVLTGAWEDRITTATAALHSARRTGAPEQEANVLLARGEALAHLRRPEAEPDLTHAAALAQDTGNIHLQIAARTELGQVTRRQNRLTEALRHFEDALTLSRGFGPGRWEAVTEGNLADLHADLGNHHQAIDHGTRSARLRHAIGDTDGEACALATVARGWQGTGDHHTALTHARHAVDLGRTSIGSHEETLARPLTILATSLHHLGHAAEAVACWREAAQIYADKGLDADANALHRHIRTATPPPTTACQRHGELQSAARVERTSLTGTIPVHTGSSVLGMQVYTGGSRSPRPQGCSVRDDSGSLRGLVLPADAGMVPLGHIGHEVAMA
ncbi:tetratricopeptide repeat protein [Streptomyces sp. SJ1-7]|nr:tetratricopeptide repeat protein [Streptomyces sp. SJ1-7]